MQYEKYNKEEYLFHQQSVLNMIADAEKKITKNKREIQRLAKLYKERGKRTDGRSSKFARLSRVIQSQKRRIINAKEALVRLEKHHKHWWQRW